MRVPRPERRAALWAGLLATLALSVAPLAQADIGGTIIEHCLRAESLAGYSQSAYRKALKELSATSEEYSDCASLIHQAQTAAATSRHGSGGSAGAGPGTGAPAGVTAATPTEQRAIERAASSGAAPVTLGNGQVVHPGVVHADVASALSTLPGPLLAVLGFLLACLLVIGGEVLRKRARERRSH
jgi:hypothetical protein